MCLCVKPLIYVEYPIAFENTVGKSENSGIQHFLQFTILSKIQSLYSQLICHLEMPSIWKSLKILSFGNGLSCLSEQMCTSCYTCKIIILPLFNLKSSCTPFIWMMVKHFSFVCEEKKHTKYDYVLNT